MREIKYVCNKTPDIFTCHSIFSKLTNCGLSKISVNAYSKQPEYAVRMEDRVITLNINEDDLSVVRELPKELVFNHNGGTLIAILWSDKTFEVENRFKNGQFIEIFGTISMAKTLTGKQEISRPDGEVAEIKTLCPVTPFGTFQDGERQRTFDYLENRLGIDLRTQIDSKKFRFEMISYKHFEKNKSLFSSSNGNKFSIHNVFNFSIQCWVKDSEKLNRMQYFSIGKKRSYGLGNFHINTINKDEKAL